MSEWWICYDQWPGPAEHPVIYEGIRIHVTDSNLCNNPSFTPYSLHALGVL